MSKDQSPSSQGLRWMIDEIQRLCDRLLVLNRRERMSINRPETMVMWGVIIGVGKGKPTSMEGMGIGVSRASETSMSCRIFATLGGL